MFVTQDLNGIEGEFVDREKTLAGVEEIISA
jgi:hypothetical protein